VKWKNVPQEDRLLNGGQELPYLGRGAFPFNLRIDCCFSYTSDPIPFDQDTEVKFVRQSDTRTSPAPITKIPPEPEHSGTSALHSLTIADEVATPNCSGFFVVSDVTDIAIRIEDAGQRYRAELIDKLANGHLHAV
jgi:hypothetical protein